MQKWFSRNTRYLQNAVLIVLIVTPLILLYVYTNLTSACLTDKAAPQVERYKEPLVFIGGYPRSGTTLMRVLLDVHSKVRCGPETRILPALMKIAQTSSAENSLSRINEAGIDNETIDSAFVMFITEVIYRSGPRAERLCVKDPFLDKSMTFLMRIFPNSKFILMIRDGRAVANSIIRRNVSIRGLDYMNPEVMLRTWNKHNEAVSQDCKNAGSRRCLTVKYESLVIKPRQTMTQILEFLNLPWEEAVLHHENKMEEVSLAKREKSTSQVVHPIYLESLSSWASAKSAIPESLIRDSISFSMLRVYGYANLSIPPVYGEPEKEVLEQNRNLQNNPEFKKLFS